MIASTAPWDQPRNATTITLRGRDMRQATAEELLLKLKRESPQLLEPAIEHVHSPRGNDWVICLISWRNRCVAPVTTRDVRLRAAELLERHGWTPNVVPEGSRPLNLYRALQEAAEQLEVPRLRMPALRELRQDLGVLSIFEWETGICREKRPGFDVQLIQGPAKTVDEVLQALRVEPWRPPAADAGDLITATEPEPLAQQNVEAKGVLQ